MGKPEQFAIHIPQTRLDALQRRLTDVEWPADFGNESGQYGVPGAWMRKAVAYWRDEFDWRAVEADMNRFAHYKVTIDDVPIHFIHVKSNRPNAIPLILTHGWPWSFWDWRYVIEPLADPQDDTSPAFDVVVPSLPGYDFSNPLRKTGIDLPAVARLWYRLMTDLLGYDRFAAAGGDWGSLLTSQIGHLFPQDVIAVNMTLPLMPGVDIYKLLESPFPPEEQWMADRQAEATPTLLSHIAVHQADPQTLAYALQDSPVGLAAWLWERRLAWSDPRQDSAARDLDSLCTLASLYWLNEAVSSSLRIYWEHFAHPWERTLEGPLTISVPTGFTIGRKEIVLAPRAAMDELVNLKRWTIVPQGGHFLPAEAPEAVVEEYRTFFGGLN